MLKYYQYIYYHIFKWQERVWGKPDAYVSAFILMNVIIFFLMLNITAIISQIIDYSIISAINQFIDGILVLCVLSLVINYFAILYKKQFKVIIKNYSRDTIKERKVGIFIAILTFVGNFILFFIIIILLWLRSISN